MLSKLKGLWWRVNFEAPIPKQCLDLAPFPLHRLVLMETGLKPTQLYPNMYLEQPLIYQAGVTLIDNGPTWLLDFLCELICLCVCKVSCLSVCACVSVCVCMCRCVCVGVDVCVVVGVWVCVPYI